MIELTSIIGWNVPDATHLTDGLVAFILPIVVMGLFVGLAHQLGNKGPSNSLLMRVSFFIGCILGMLSLNASPANVVPFAFPIVTAIFLITYIWKGK
jgi:hypothetical protein